MRVTLHEVANAVGVSVTAVSSVLNNQGGKMKVSDETAELIRAKACELNYRPNVLARSLRLRRTNTVGVVFQHLLEFGDQNPHYWQELLDGIMSVLFPRDYTLSLCPRLVSGKGPERIEDGRFDGILWCAPDFSDVTVDIIDKSSTPIVLMHAPPESAPGVPVFTANNDAAMESVVAHLKALGHERVAFVIDSISAQSAERVSRANAFLLWTQKYGLRGDVLSWSYDAGELESYVGAGAPHTALSVCSDFHAGRILSRAKDLGIHVPQDLSVVGFDSSSFCDRTTPRLTSIHQPVKRMAQEATTCLLDLVCSERPPSGTVPYPPVIYDCGLDVRDSTAPPNPRRGGI